jgi:phage/plasmid-like protein (TIGR03299 family)
MGHELEFDQSGARFVYAVGNNPWHKLGTEITEPMTIAKALELARLAGWDLRKRAIYARDVERNNMRKIDGHVAVYRQSDGSTLGVVGEDYEVFSNEETFLGLGNALGQLGLPVITAGSLRKGSRTFMCFAHPDDATLPNGDTIKGHLLISTSHDGSLALSAADVEIVVVCQNTLSAALDGHSSIFRIKHTRNMRDSIEEARKLLTQAQAARDAKIAAANRLLGIKISMAQWTDFLAALIPIEPDADRKDRKVSRAFSLRDTIDMVYREQPSQDNKRGTAWGAYNAVTFYTNHIQTRRKTEQATAEENRMDALTLGTDSLADRALVLLTR